MKSQVDSKVSGRTVHLNGENAFMTSRPHRSLDTRLAEQHSCIITNNLIDNRCHL